MALRRTLATLAFTGALVASPALAAGPMPYGQAPPGTDTQSSYGETQTNGNPTNGGDAQMNATTPDDTTACCAGEASPMTSDRDSIEGTVAAVDHEEGRLVLDTDQGLVSLRTSPEELANVDLGDTVRVSFTDDVR